MVNTARPSAPANERKYLLLLVEYRLAWTGIGEGHVLLQTESEPEMQPKGALMPVTRGAPCCHTSLSKMCHLCTRLTINPG